MPIRAHAMIFMLAVAVGCGGASHVAEDGGGPGIDAGPALRDAGPAVDAGGAVREDAAAPPPMPPVLCGGRECAAAEACCTETGSCYDPTPPGGCALTMPPPPESGSGTTCASDADCAGSQFCRVPSGSCIGAGWCFGRDHAGISCSGGQPVCACDGRTYATLCDAYEAGATVSRAGEWAACGSAGPSGVVACGRDTDCPSGRVCCARTSICIDPTCVACCAAPPPGTALGCGTDLDCRALANARGSSDYWCFGTGCGDTGGGCVRTVSGDCTGALVPVCGCDGITYTNACWAQAAHTRIAHEGMCG